MRFLLIALSIFIGQASFAYSKENLFAFYQKFYEDQLGIGFFKKNYHIRKPRLRKQILDYMKTSSLEVNREEVSQAWNIFIKENFPNPSSLETIARDNYYNLDQAKHKFIEDLDLRKYFVLIVLKELEEDLEFKEKLVNSVIKTKISDQDRLEAKTQFFVNNQIKNDKEMNAKLGIDQEDLSFLIESNYALNKKSFTVYNLDLQKRIYNLKQNSQLSNKEAKTLILRNHENRIRYLN